jgi:hypothetical protein
MEVLEKYKKQLDLIRQNPDLLNDYRFDAGIRFDEERLHLNIAIYNDWQQSDYEIAKFIFNEENKWQNDSWGFSEEVNFSALILTKFENPEVIWLFWDSKSSSFDSSIGFDGEYLVFLGIEKTYQYLEAAEHPSRKDVLKYIGETLESCIYTQENIDRWKESKKRYFRNYDLNAHKSVKDELWFLFSTKEKELFMPKLAEWLKQPIEWSEDNLGSFITFAKYSGDKFLEIEAHLLTLEKNDKGFYTDIDKRNLSQLYIDVGEYEKAFGIMNNIIAGTDNKNVIRDCLEQLCEIIFKNENRTNEIVIKSFAIIQREKNKYKNFSPHVDNLINRVTQIMIN